MCHPHEGKALSERVTGSTSGNISGTCVNNSFIGVILSLFDRDGANE